MLKTSLKAFVFSFSASLFTIVCVNRAFFYEKTDEPLSLDIADKNITLYLSDTIPDYLPVKKIALNALPAPLKKQKTIDQEPEREIILASALEPLDIPLEYIEPQQSDVVSEDIVVDKSIVLADVLYAPDKPLPEIKIDAEPVYQPDEPKHVSNNVANIDAPTVYSPTQNNDDSKISPPPLFPTLKEDNSLALARAETIGSIPLVNNRTDKSINKVSIGNPQELQHVAYADKNTPIQSMQKSSSVSNQDTATAVTEKEWRQMNDSPWVVARSAGGKNALAKKAFDKSEKEIAEILNPSKDIKGVKLASETAKNLIIPIPESILKEKDITPQLAYPASSKDKEKEIDINAKIKEAEAKKKSEKEASDKEKKAQKDILKPVDDDLGDLPDINITKITQPDAEKEANNTSAPVDKKDQNIEKKDGFIDTLSSLFTKTSQTISEAKDKAIAKAKSKRSALNKKNKRNKELAIIPTEIRLSFQPNRAEISGQTLKWIQAFATKVAQTPGMALEIRIDGTMSTKLQQNRLNLLYNILTHKGVDYSMINTVFTARDPNSFILRTISANNDNNKNKGVNNKNSDRYIQW